MINCGIFLSGHQIEKLKYNFIDKITEFTRM